MRLRGLWRDARLLNRHDVIYIIGFGTNNMFWFSSRGFEDDVTSFGIWKPCTSSCGCQRGSEVGSRSDSRNLSKALYRLWSSVELVVRSWRLWLIIEHHACYHVSPKALIARLVLLSIETTDSLPEVCCGTKPIHRSYDRPVLLYTDSTPLRGLVNEASECERFYKDLI